MSISGKKFLTFLYWVVLVLSVYILLYEVLDIKELTIDRYIDNSYGDALYNENGVLVNPRDAERRVANVPWYGYPLKHLFAYSLLAELFLIPVTALFTVFFTAIRWKELGRRILVWKDIRWQFCMYIPIMAFAIYTMIFLIRHF